MKYVILLLIILSVVFVFQRSKKADNILPGQNQVSQVGNDKDNTDKTKVIAQNLDTPWSIDFLPNGNLLATQRNGEVDEVNPKTGEVKKIAKLDQVKEIGEGGLLGLALDPSFSKNNFVYLYYTSSGDENNTLNKVVRMVYKDNKLSDENTIVDDIPGAPNHNGGRIKFGPDGNLYIATGDAQNPSQAQDLSSLSGKILRVIGGNVEIYSYGHRNPQGLAWDKDGQLWATEHGRSGAASGLDELNRIDQGKNYGWPTIEGDKAQEGMETPILHSGATVTWAPAGLAYVNGSLFWGGLRGQTLYEGVIEGNKVNLKEHFKGEFGRIREVVAGPDSMIYITTSNLDGRGIPKDGDDKIIQISP